ncbi:hypothetical protein EVAR_37914_1 [Eumeta japonica]|uniref:Uncharacterized protein n=1 Tax=Eumeta variegata TaxID=151549 RepID=A0A4C1XFZ8_EUMVA|nr:hypothetical protein EVAR_37914_1 [Eumeta japonica]
MDDNLRRPKLYMSFATFKHDPGLIISMKYAESSGQPKGREAHRGLAAVPGGSGRGPRYALTHHVNYNTRYNNLLNINFPQAFPNSYAAASFCRGRPTKFVQHNDY